MADQSRQTEEERREEKNRLRRERYASDPEYRRRRIDAASKAKKKKAGKRKPADPARTVAKIRSAQMEMDMTITVNGADLVVRMVTIGWLAEQMGMAVTSVRNWEVKGYLPPPLYRNARNQRLYTMAQARRILAAHRDHYHAHKSKLKDSPFHHALQAIWTEMPQGVAT